MTKREFFEARAKADYLKRHGAIQCPPAAADGSAPITRFQRKRVKSKVALTYARKMTTPTLAMLRAFGSFTAPIRKEDES